MSWAIFGNELTERLINPWKSETFIGYFIVCIMLIGTLGVSVTIYEYWGTDELYKIAFSLSTYSIAITASAFVDLNLSPKVKNKSSFFIYSLLVFLLCTALLIFTYMTKNNNAFYYSVFGSIFAWLLWIIANSDNDSLKPSLDTIVHENVINHTKNWE